jgi:serine phosphatase RsbU (regulator of sigma subunit)
MANHSDSRLRRRHNSLVARSADTEGPAAAGELLEKDKQALGRFTAAVRGLVENGSLAGALAELVEAAAAATEVDLVIVRTADPGEGELVARAVHAGSAALAAELEGSRLAAAELGREEVGTGSASTDPALPAAVRRAASRARMETGRLYPLVVGGVPLATLELFRSGGELDARETLLGRLAAAHVAVAVRLERSERHSDGRGEPSLGSLEVLGEALAAGADETETAEHIVRLAAEATGAAGATLWRAETDAPPSFLAQHGFDDALPDLSAAAEAVARAVSERRAAAEVEDGAAQGWTGATATLALGEPPVGALQLYFEGEGPANVDVELLSPFAARAALALRRSHRVGLIATALQRSQTVIGVVSQAIARLSLAHTLDTAVERIAELTSSGHVAVYLREGERLTAAASRGLKGSHPELAERLLELALGPFRGRGFLFIEDMRRDPRLRGLEGVLQESSIRRALLIPLVVRDEVIGALGVFKTRPRPYREGEEGLLIALSSQLAVAVQNARLHERSRELSEVLEHTLQSERHTARQLRGLYEISRSFAQSLSLEATLDAVVRTMVELFELDAAAIRMPDERGEALETRALRVADPSFREAAAAILGRPQPMTAPLARRLLRSGRPVLLEPGTGASDDVHRLLEPFLTQGSTAAVLPLGTPPETLGTLTLLSLDPARPLDPETVDAAMAVAAQAALAIDNARLYQQQKDFSETMQRSLLPRALPVVPGLEVGHVYQSSARVDVGGDVYDFLPLEDGRLAVVIGDVTGKGIEAAADMALAKFTFRALARKYPGPSAFLLNANEVVFQEVAATRFITMLYVLIDPARRELACANAGHPPPRMLAPDGTVSEVTARGLALGIESGQEYEVKQEVLEPGSSVVLYTDGVIEARRDGTLYGEARLDKVLSQHRKLGPQELAEAILADCRSFSGGELADDCAVVCLRLAS